MTIVAYEPRHLLELRHQEWQRGSTYTLADAEILMQGHCAFTALCDVSGRPLVCAGIVPLWPNRAMCWANLDIDARPVMLQAHRRTLTEIDRAPFKRLEMYVVPGFVSAWRWAEMLGFKLESVMEAGSPSGKDLFVFARIKRGKVAERLQ